MKNPWRLKKYDKNLACLYIPTGFYDLRRDSSWSNYYTASEQAKMEVRKIPVIDNVHKDAKKKKKKLSNTHTSVYNARTLEQ